MEPLHLLFHLFLLYPTIVLHLKDTELEYNGTCYGVQLKL